MARPESVIPETKTDVALARARFHCRCRSTRVGTFGEGSFDMGEALLLDKERSNDAVQGSLQKLRLPDSAG
jgi:hypothetical protein